MGTKRDEIGRTLREDCHHPRSQHDNVLRDKALKAIDKK
jgi:hypothetical protein